MKCGNDGGFFIIVDFADPDAIGKPVVAIFAGDGRECMASSLE